MTIARLVHTLVFLVMALAFATAAFATDYSGDTTTAAVIKRAGLVDNNTGVKDAVSAAELAAKQGEGHPVGDTVEACELIKSERDRDGFGADETDLVICGAGVKLSSATSKYDLRPDSEIITHDKYKSGYNAARTKAVDIGFGKNVRWWPIEQLQWSARAVEGFGMMTIWVQFVEMKGGVPDSMHYPKLVRVPGRFPAYAWNRVPCPPRLHYLWNIKARQNGQKADLEAAAKKDRFVAERKRLEALRAAGAPATTP